MTTIEDIISENSSIEVGANDLITYEVEDTNILEVLNDGTIIPNKNGTSKVKLKMNGKDIGFVEVTIKDGAIEKIIGKEEDSEVSSQVVSNSDNEKVNFESKSENNLEEQENKELENQKKFSIIPVIIIVIIILIFILIVIKKRRKK